MDYGYDFDNEAWRAFDSMSSPEALGMDGPAPMKVLQEDMR